MNRHIAVTVRTPTRQYAFVAGQSEEAIRAALEDAVQRWLVDLLEDMKHEGPIMCSPLARLEIAVTG